MHTAGTSPEIMDVNDAAVQNVFRRAGVRNPYSRPHASSRVHRLDIDGAEARRLVLGDWHRAGSVLHWKRSGAELRVLPR
jgi:UDP-2,3-diacylglucosamine hydrolase